MIVCDTKNTFLAHQDIIMIKLGQVSLVVLRGKFRNGLALITAICL